MRRAVSMFDQLPKGLGRDVHSRIQLSAVLGPSSIAPLEHGHLGPAEFGRTVSRPLGQIALTVVAPDQSCRWPGNEGFESKLQLRQWQVDCVEEMFVAVRPFLPSVQDRQLETVR